jgi:NAD-dependent SIR2 family protein deacetylase
MSRKEFTCIHCGEKFNLNPADQEDYNEGFFDHTPNTCDDCMEMMNFPGHDISDLHSDADPGL